MTALWSGIKEVLTVSYEANEAITQWLAVKLVGDATVDLTDSQGEKVLGIAMHDAAVGEMVKILVIGICPVIIATAASFARWDNWTPTAIDTTHAGKVEEAASSDYVGGYLLDAPAADDDQVMATVDCARHVILA